MNMRGGEKKVQCAGINSRIGGHLKRIYAVSTARRLLAGRPSE
jgi:hypothetical protein